MKRSAMPYNGELKELFNDVDKRIAVSEAERAVWNKAHDDTSHERHKETKEYREKMEKKIDGLISVMGKLPCKTHINEFKWFKRCLWIMAICIGSMAGFMATIHMGG